MVNQFVPPNGLPDATLVGTDGTTLGVLKTGTVKTDGGDVSNTVATANGGDTHRKLNSIFGDRINALDYGVSANSPDNAVALQAAINAAASSGKCLYIPSGVYKYTPPLTIKGPLHIVGDGCLPLFGSLGQDTLYNAVNIPMVYPFFSGTVLLPASNGQSAFICTIAGLAISGSDFSVSFQTPFKNTGHMLDYQPADMSSGGHDIGLMGGVWSNVGLYGHDGDHYMFNIYNNLYCRFVSCMAFGGGLLNSYMTTGGSGNSYFERCTNMIIVGGAAHGYSFTASSSATNQLNTLVSCQCITDPQPHQAGITPSAPTSAQLLINCDNRCAQFTIISPDMESPVGSPNQLATDRFFVDRAHGGLETGTRYPSGVDTTFALDYLQRGSLVQRGTVTSTTTTGTITFQKTFWHGEPPNVILQGIGGVTAELSAAPVGNQFSYTLSSPGSFQWLAMGGA